MHLRSLLVVVSIFVCARPALADLVVGRVVDPSGAGVASVNLDAFDLATGNPVTILNDGTDANGFFIATIAPGVYRLVFRPPPPPATTWVVHEVASVVVSGTKDLGAVGLASGVALAGRSVDAGGFPVADVDVDVVDEATGLQIPLQGDHTDAFGNFRIAVPKIPLEVRFRTDGLAPLLAPRALGLTLAVDTNLGNVLLRPGFYLTGTVQRTSGPAVAGVDTDVLDELTGDKLFTPNDNTNASGVFEVVVPAGNYAIEFCPRPADLLVGKELLGVAVTQDTDVGVVTLQAGVVLSGTIKDSLGAPVPNADVDLRYTATGVSVVLCFDNASASGAYSVVVPTGTFDITYSPPGPGCSSSLLEDFDPSVVLAANTVRNAVLPPMAVPCTEGKGAASGAPSASVEPADEADFFGRPLSGPAPLTVDFHTMARGRWGRHDWSFGDGDTSRQKEPVHTYATPGLYTVSLTVQRNFGAISHTETKSGYVLVTSPRASDGGTPDLGPVAARPRASARPRAGGNLSCFTSDLPLAGRPWTARVDTTAVPNARFSLVVGYEAPRSAVGARSLLFDPTSARLFVSLLPARGGRDAHAIPLPDDPALLGRTLTAQGFLLASDGLWYCNAIDLSIGD